MTFTAKLVPIEEEQILEETISLGFIRQKSLCIREREDAWLLRLPNCGKCSARVVTDAVQLPADAVLCKGTNGIMQIYDDTKLVAIIVADKVDFYVMPNSNEIIIRLTDSRYPIRNVKRHIYDYYKRDERRLIWTRDWERHCNMQKKKLKTSSD